MLLRCFLACAVLGACAGGPSSEEPFAVTFDPCEPVFVSAIDATDAELASLQRAATMWNDVGIATIEIVALDAESDLIATDFDQEIPLHFERAAGMFYGFYDPELGDLYINRNLEDPQGRAVTMAHEIGHAFGLRHVTGHESVMTTPNLVTPPNESDAEALRALWGRCAETPPPLVAY